MNYICTFARFTKEAHYSY